ncbi:MAG: ATP-binding protein [Candidatus Omnitrophica bacterium]|nr:ATP-binding protein [Candidatus Omnitrophota bacterium]
MADFFKAQIDYIFFIYGMSFFILSAACLLLIRVKEAKLPWFWLGLFGFAHAINEWLDLFSISIGDTPVFRMSRLAVMLLSFIFLAEFSRLSYSVLKGKTLSRWFFIPWLLLVCSGWYSGKYNGFNFTCRYLLGFASAFGSGITLILYALRLKDAQRRLIFALGCIIIAYGLTQLVISNPPFLLKLTLFNQDNFASFFGFPIQLLRCALIVCAAFIILVYWCFMQGWLDSEGLDKKRRRMVLSIGLVYLILIALGWLITQNIGAYFRRLNVDELSVKANTVSAAIDYRQVETLTASPADIGTPGYERLKEQLKAIKEANVDLRFIYLMRLEHGKIIFLADSGPDSSAESSPPGQVYEEAPPELRSRFLTRRAFIIDAYTDRWGSWISTFAPVMDLENNRLVALIGMDMDAKLWHQKMFLYRLVGIFISFCMFILFSVFFIINQINRASAEKIAVSQKHLQTLIDNIPSPVFYKNKQGKYLGCNFAFAQFFGLAKEAVTGKTVFDINPRYAAEINYRVDRELFSLPNGGSKIYEAEILDAQNIKHIVLLSKSTYPGPDGKVAGLVGVMQDITERKRILDELKEKNIALEKLDQLKSDFVSIVSHELRTPLSITKEGISLVLDGVTGAINPKQNKVLVTSKDNIDRLARIINSLLDISKIESGKVELIKKTVDLEVLINKVVSSFESMAKEKGLEIRTILPKEKGLSLFIDEDRIMQVFTNLISNSLKFTDKGYIDISFMQRENEVEFTVSDTGIGIAENDLPKVFTKFMQFGRIPGAGEKGTGLGLSIAKGLIDLHRGKIWVESAAGKGTKFIFTLPKYSANENAREYIEDAINDAHKSRKPVTLAVVTFSYSDKIKDNYNTLSEDLLKIIRSQLHRGKDLALEYQNEFFIIMQDCQKNCGLVVRGRIEQALRSYFENMNLSNDVKMHFGLATYPDDANGYQSLVDKAKLA